MTFKEDLERAKPYETAIMQYANHLEDVKEIIDVREDKKYQDLDIDFIILYTDGGFNRIEIKADFFTTNNFFLEVVSNKIYHTQGCLLKSQSEYIWYVFINLNELYIINTKKLKNWLYNTKVELTAGGDNALGVKIKRSDLYKYVKYKKKEIYL